MQKRASLNNNTYLLDAEKRKGAVGTKKGSERKKDSLVQKKDDAQSSLPAPSSSSTSYSTFKGNKVMFG